MAVARQPQPARAPEMLPLQMADNRNDPLWHKGREQALLCAEAALVREDSSGGGWGLLALVGGLLAVLTGADR